MTRLSSLSVSEKQFIDAAVFAAERAKGARLSGTEKNKVLATARQQIISQRDSNRIVRQRHESAQERLFEWKKPFGFSSLTRAARRSLMTERSERMSEEAE
ncbi:hypothetical protein R0L47_23430 (plasmid) [Pectobacterium polonicum]|uniref:hypothetical protein n=1 Tax=Pectobacterium polonicum TaxID=2485124 RepID=UPI003754E3C9